MSLFNRARTSCALALTLAASSLTHAGYTQVVSFGDSLSDVGNVFNATAGATPGAPYFNGRFSDGPVWTEVLATGLGLLPAGASTAGGGNFAWGGARVTVGTGAGNVPSTQEQIGQYLGATAGVADPNALYTVLIGGNDINAYNPGGADPMKPAYEASDLVADAQAVAGQVQSLIAAGANNIMVANVPDLGGAPVCDGAEAGCTQLTQLFNGNLFGALAGLDQSKLIYLDLFTASQDINNNLAAYGFNPAVAGQDCLATGAYTGPGSCDGHVFWDSLHPTSTAHFEIGQVAAASAVPIPAALPLLLSALMGLGAAKRARKA